MGGKKSTWSIVQSFLRSTSLESRQTHTAHEMVNKQRWKRINDFLYRLCNPFRQFYNSLCEHTTNKTKNKSEKKNREEGRIEKKELNEKRAKRKGEKNSNLD